MLEVPHPEVLAHDWLPPTLIRRGPELSRLQEFLGDPIPTIDGPWFAGVRGPPGSGTSALARLAARRLLDAFRREHPAATPPMLVPVRVRWSAGTLGVASTLLQHLDEGFSGRGFPVVEVVAGFLRRVARTGRPAIVILDDIGPDTPDLSPILRGLLHPLRFLPEGVDAAPPVWTLVAGSIDPSGVPRSWARVGVPRDRFVTLPPMEPAMVRAVISDRAERALGRSPPTEWVERLLVRSEDRALGASRTLDLLRRELLGPSAARIGTLFAPRGAPPVLEIEPRVIEAMDRAARDGTIPLAELRAWEARLAVAEGARPLPATTLWRRLVRLEAAGLVRREVRTGGPGGTRSNLELLRPVSEWPVPPMPVRTRRDVAAFVGAGPRGPVPSAPVRSARPAVPGWGGAAGRPSLRAPPS